MEQLLHYVWKHKMHFSIFHKLLNIKQLTKFMKIFKVH